MFRRRQWRKLHTNCLQTCSAIRVWRQQNCSSNLWGDNYVSYILIRAVQKKDDGLMPLLWNNQQSFDFPNLIFEQASAAKDRHLWNHLPSFDFPNHVPKNMPLGQNAVIWKITATFKTWLQIYLTIGAHRNKKGKIFELFSSGSTWETSTSLWPMLMPKHSLS